jgi:hypothetical protein
MQPRSTGCRTALLAILPAAALLLSAAARAQTSDPLPPETVLVTGSGAPAATEESFSIAAVASGSTQPDLLVTFTDLQAPAALSAASVVVTQGATIVGTTSLAAQATTATLVLPAAVGQYTLRVIGTPNATAAIPAGSFTVCVAPKATPTACIADASVAGSVATQSTTADPTVSTLAETLTVAIGGSYTFTYGDDQFPVALKVPPTLALFQGSAAIAVPVPASPATITLNPGTYTLLGFAQADPTLKAGLYGITIAGPPGVLLNSAYPVGLLGPASPVNNPSAQSLGLTVKDFAFPAALASATAVVTSGGTLLGTATAGGGASMFTAPMGALQVWSNGVAGTTGPGTYEVDLTASSASLLQLDLGIGNGSSFAYALTTPNALAAASYQATGNDFQFPSALTSLQFAVAQNGAILAGAKASAPGTVNFTAAAGPAVLLVAATPVSSTGSGLFDVNIQTSGSAAQLVFDQVQPVSASGGFTSQLVPLQAGSYDVTLTDLDFPTQFATLALIGSSNGASLGKVYGSGTSTITATSGNYQFTLIAIPASAQQYGLYGLQIANSPATITSFAASPATVTVGASTTLSWTTTNATACTGTGTGFAGSQAMGSGSASVMVAATTTYTLTCTGPGGSSNPQSVTVTATTAPAKSGGGGSIDMALLGLLGALGLVRSRSMNACNALKDPNKSVSRYPA